MAIAATRMHRSLVDSASGSTDVYVVLHSFAFLAHCGQSSFTAPGNGPNGDVPFQEIKWINAASIPTDGTKITMHIASEQSRTPRTGEDDLCISTNKHMTK